MALMVQIEEIASFYPDLRPHLEVGHGEGVGIAGAERYHDGIYWRAGANCLDVQIARMCPYQLARREQALIGWVNMQEDVGVAIGRDPPPVDVASDANAGLHELESTRVVDVLILIGWRAG